MSSIPSLSEAVLARECLQRLGDKGSILAQATHALELISRTDGLGEVLRDFARQTSGQLRDLMNAARRVVQGTPDADDMEILRQSHLMLKTAGKVLEMAPVAMQRNKANEVGDKETMPRADIVKIEHQFRQSPDVQRLLASEDAGQLMAAQIMTPGGSLVENKGVAALTDAG